MRRRKSYTANSDVLGVLFHNMGAAADKRRAEQDRGRRKQQQKIESFQRRQEKSEHYEEMRREKKERLRFEKSDELLIGYRLPSAVTPWVIDYMDSERCDLRHVKREIFEPFSKGKRSVAETIALLAVDKDGDGSNEFEQIALVFDWYDLHDLSRPALIEYLLTTGLPIADIEDRLVKAIAERGLALPEVYDLICTSDESADRDSFVAQTVLDWDLGEEWVAPIVEVVRDSDMTFEDLRQKFLPALVAEARVDAEAAQSAKEAQTAAEATARRIAWISRLLAAAVTFMSLWLPIAEGWTFAFPAGIGALVLSFILPSMMTAENIAWPALGTFLGILVVGYGGGLWSFPTKLLVFFGIVALGMILSRLLESGVPAAKIPKREPGEMARAASAQVT